MTKKCFKCGKEMELVGFDYVAGSIDEITGEPETWWIVAVYVCHNCKIFVHEDIEEVTEDPEYVIEKYFGGKWAKIPEGYVGLP